MKQEIADLALELLEEKGWWGGGTNHLADGDGRKVCGGRAVVAAVQLGGGLDVNGKPVTGHTHWDHIREIGDLAAAVVRLFPDRIGWRADVWSQGCDHPGWLVMEVNDHRSTSREDMQLAIKHAAEGP